MATQRSTIQEVIDSRLQWAFIGRRAELDLFKDNLGYDAGDRRRCWILNVHGPDGVGKTFLLSQWSRIARAAGVVNASLTETVEDVLQALHRIAVAFADQGVPLKQFRARYDDYERRYAELLTGPAPAEEGASGWTTTVLRLSLKAAREIPVMKVAAAVADDEAVVRSVAQLRRYLKERLRNDDDAHLLATPIEVLSRLLADDLRQLDRHRFALFVDDYEHSGRLLEPWLLNLLDGRYGGVPQTLTIIVAGQKPLDANAWAPYRPLLADVKLEPFTEREARELLAQHRVTDEHVIDVILALSGRLPLLLSQLAAGHPDHPEAVGDLDSIVERFLRWESDLQRREIALEVALARWFNRDLLAALRGKEAAAHLWDWLRDCPFVHPHVAGYQYDQTVRTTMSRLYLRRSPEDWRRLHQVLAAHHMACRDGLGLRKRDAWENADWLRHAQEATYHQLCATPHGNLADSLDQVLRAFEEDPALARRWIEAIQQAGADRDADKVQRWARRLQAAADRADWLRLVTMLLDEAELPEQRRADGLCARGRLHREAGRYQSALADFNRALDLRSGNDDRALAGRGVTYLAMERYDEAVADLTKATGINPGNAWAFAHRGQAHLCLRRHAAAVEDFSSAVKLDSRYVWAIAHRGETYRLMGRHEEALADFDRAIGLDPELHWVIANRGMTLLSMGRYDEAVAGLTLAIESDPGDARVIAHRGETYRLMGRHEEAMADFDKAIALGLDPELQWVIANRDLLA